MHCLPVCMIKSCQCMHVCMIKQHLHLLTHVYLISPLAACIHLYLVPKRVSGVVLSLTTAANGEAAIAVTWDTPVDDVAIDHYEVMYVVSQHPAAGGTDTSTGESLSITGVVKGAVYNVRVRAVSAYGGYAGEYSTVQPIIVPVGEE